MVMCEEHEKVEWDLQDWSLRRYNRAHVCRVYELCNKDAPRAGQLLDLPPDEVLRWVALEDGD